MILIPFFHLFPERSDVSIAWGNPVCLGKTPAATANATSILMTFTVFFDLFLLSSAYDVFTDSCEKSVSRCKESLYGSLCRLRRSILSGDCESKRRYGPFRQQGEQLMPERPHRGHEKRRVIHLVLDADDL